MHLIFMEITHHCVCIVMRVGLGVGGGRRLLSQQPDTKEGTPVTIRTEAGFSLLSEKGTTLRLNMELTVTHE